MAADDTRPTAVAIRSYMRNSGWRESTQGTVGSVWTKGDAKFCVPHEGDDPDLIQRALVRLASAEGRTPEETGAAILARRPVAASAPPVSDDSGRDLPARHAQARPRLEALSPDDREALGRLVREVWVACAREHPDPKPSWLVPWEGLGEWDKETDRRIGASLALHGAATAAVRMHELHVREIEAAEAKLAEVRSVLLEGGQGDATARRRAIAIVGTEERLFG